MSTKKLLYICSGFVLMLLLLVVGAGKTYASSDSLELGLRRLRESDIGYRYQANAGGSGKTIWKVVSYDSENTIDWSKALYCIRAEQGFGSDWTNDAESAKVEYNVRLDMKDEDDKNEILNSYNKIPVFNSTTNYNKLLWILDNIYLPKDSTETEKKSFLEKIPALTTYGADSNLYIENKKIAGTPAELTDDDIEAVQQMAIWYLTNQDSSLYHVNQLKTMYINRIAGTDANYASIEDVLDDRTNDMEYGAWKKEFLDDIYNYFISEFDNKGSYTGVISGHPISLGSTDATVGTVKMQSTTTSSDGSTSTKYTTNLILGPYSLNKNTEANASISLSLEDQSHNDIDYRLVDENKNLMADNDLSGLVGKKFYIVLVNNNSNASNVNINLDVSYECRDVNFYTTSLSTYQSEQPVVLVRKLSNHYTEKANAKVVFDLALRKFITTIDGKSVTVSREPKISQTELSKLYYGSSTTVEKIHPKDALEVKPNSKVVYTIRVYNEGNISGYASGITDHLPAGLKLATNSTINNQYGWSNPSGDGVTIVTNYLKDKLLNGYTLGNLAYRDIQVECEVIANYSTQQQNLRNIAEISECKDYNNNVINDRDSQVNNVQLSGYTKQQQDDDDYEDLKLPAKNFDLALRKFTTTINGKNVDVSREPVISNDEISKLKSGNTTTAEKVHPKDALVVNTNDKVVYTIRVYNEGDISGYASKITDHLPTGLKLATNSAINNQYGWSNPSGDGVTLVTNYLSNKLINAFDGSNLKYEDIKVECEVIAEVEESSINLRNIAEISECKDYNNNIVTDRDSQVNNVQLNGYTKQQQDDDDYEDLVINGKYYDFSLRKFITSVDNVPVENSREPIPDVTKLANATAQTADYNHIKNPLIVNPGNIISYTIRVYNEGTLDGYVSEITDYLPAELEFVKDDPINVANGWTVSNDGRTIKTTKLSKVSSNTNLITAFNGKSLDYRDVIVRCKVLNSVVADTKLTNIAEITQFTDKNAVVKSQDRDSISNNIVLPLGSDLEKYKDDEIASGEKYIPGQQDDDDFEKVLVKIQKFDFSLRKFITQVNDKEVSKSREPIPDVTGLVNGTSTTAEYNHTKDPINLAQGSIVLYTIRVYNEGTLDGYVSEITDYLPKELEFIKDDPINVANGWTVSEDGRIIKTTKLSKNSSEDNLIKAFNGAKLEYKDVVVKCKVSNTAAINLKLTNIAEITKFTDKNGIEKNEDIDSQPSNVVLPSDDKLPEYKESEITSGEKYIPGQQDDDDFEKVQIKLFDLALRKFITGVDDMSVNNRYPVVTLGEDGKLVYNHTKEPIDVENGNVVTYTIRIFNEGTEDGYASEITDDVPNGLKFINDNEINKEYGWILSEDGKSIKTKYLSKENEKTSGVNLIKAFNPNAEVNDKNPDYRDVKVAFLVTEPNTSDRVIINTAEISDDSDKDGKPIDDIDSIPGNGKEDEDDIDKEYIKVKYFDLALRKWVTKVNIIDGKNVTTTETGHHAEDNPEDVVKVEIPSKKINTMGVKYTYSIRVTNEGQIPGYATEVKDYIPDGLKFVAEDNPLWEQKEDGSIVTTQLKDSLLKPGDSADVEIILTWINSADNMGLKVNQAEISKDYNDSNTPDIDSTPDNRVDGEDDIDDAPVILSVKTGDSPKYYLMILAGVVVISIGTIVIKKYVLGNEHR